IQKQHQRIHYSAQGQSLENSLYNTKDRIYYSAKSTKEQILENSLPNDEGVQEITSIKSLQSAKSAKRQNAREFTIQY
ncbi:4619_t:CDS:2, partial [Gigaspora margarita]